MLGNFVKLCSKSDYTLGNIEIRDEQHIQTRIIKLYPKYKIYLEPNSVTYIPLRCRQNTEVKFDKDRDLLVKGNKNFEKRKLLQIDNMTICTWRNPTIAVYNTQDTGISLSKSDVVASAESCDDDMQYHANIQLLRRFQGLSNDKEQSLKSESLILAEMVEGDKGHPNEMSPQDKRHFSTTPEERRNYIIKTLKLNDVKENELIDSNQKLEEVIQLFLDHWGILDINGDRLAKFKCNEKLEIITEGEPIAAKTRFVNPVLAEKVKIIIDEWIKR